MIVGDLNKHLKHNHDDYIWYQIFYCKSFNITNHTTINTVFYLTKNPPSYKLFIYFLITFSLSCLQCISHQTCTPPLSVGYIPSFIFAQNILEYMTYEEASMQPGVVSYQTQTNSPGDRQYDLETKLFIQVWNLSRYARTS